MSHNVKNGLGAQRKIDRDAIDGYDEYSLDGDYLDNDRGLESEKEYSHYNYEEYPNTDSSEQEGDSSEEDDGEYIYEDNYDDDDDEYEYDGPYDEEEEENHELYDSDEAQQNEDNEYNYDTSDDYEEDDGEYEDRDGNEVGHQVLKESNRKSVQKPSFKHTSKGFKKNTNENEERIMFSDDV